MRKGYNFRMCGCPYTRAYREEGSGDSQRKVLPLPLRQVAGLHLGRDRRWGSPGRKKEMGR